MFGDWILSAENYHYLYLSLISGIYEKAAPGFGGAFFQAELVILCNVGYVDLYGDSST